MQWNKEPAEPGTAPGPWAHSEMTAVILKTSIIIYNQCLRAWDQEPLRFPCFEKINTNTDSAGIFRNEKTTKEREEGKIRPDS